MAFADEAFSAFASADAEFFGAFEATYTPSWSTAPVPVKVLIDTVTQEAGDFGGVVEVATVVTILRPSPVVAIGGFVVANGETLMIESLIEDDGDSTRWRCRRV